MDFSLNMVLIIIYICMLIAGLIGHIWLLIKRKKTEFSFPAEEGSLEDTSDSIPYLGESALEFSRLISQTQFIYKAQKRFFINTRTFNSHFYNKEIAVAFRFLAEEREVNIQFVYGPTFDIECLDFLKLALEGKIKLFRSKSRRDNVASFRVIDGIDVSHDLPENHAHPIFERHHGEFNFNNRSLALKKEEIFEDLKNDSEHITPQKLFDQIMTTTEVKPEEMNSVPCFIMHDENNEPRPATTEEIQELQKKIRAFVLDLGLDEGVLVTP